LCGAGILPDAGKIKHFFQLTGETRVPHHQIKISSYYFSPHKVGMTDD
jgi:hypothetical protein